MYVDHVRLDLGNISCVARLMKHTMCSLIGETCHVWLDWGNMPCVA